MADDDQRERVGIEHLLERREYLQGVASAGAVAALGLPAISGSTLAAGDPDDKNSRRKEAFNSRVNNSDVLVRKLKEYGNQTNDDPFLDESGEYYYGAYGKGLNITHDGSVPKEDYDELVTILQNDGDLEDIELGGERQLISPSAGRHYPTDGMDSWMGTMPAPPAYDSELLGAEMVELYWMEQFRDVPLEDLEDLEELQWGGAYTEDTTMIENDYDLEPEWIDRGAPFRGVFERSKRGPYLSQFLIKEALLGNVPMDLKVRPFEEGSDGYLNNRRGTRTRMLMGDAPTAGAEAGQGNPKSDDFELDTERWITTGRDLASFVRVDPAYVPYVIPALQLFDWGAQFDSDLPYVESDTVLQYVNYGGVGLLDLLARVTRSALNAAWYQKWYVHRRPRPAVTSNNISNDDPVDEMPDLVFDSNAYEETELDMGPYGTHYYLSLAYPEGAPTHPAYPSGHSTIGGACSTILKIFFENDTLTDLPNFESLYVPDGEGGREAIDENDTDTLTVHGEADKLAENIGMGRLWAGIHYPTDHIYGVKLGEQIAIATILDELADDFGDDIDDPEQDMDSDSYDPIENLTFTPFDPDAISDSNLNSDGTAPVTIDVLEDLREHAHNKEL